MRISDWSSDVCSSDLTQIAIRRGRTVRLSDIADVRDKYAEQRSVSLMNGRQVTSFSLEKAKGSSDVSVYDQAMEELNKIEKENPKIHFKQLYNSRSEERSVGKESVSTCRARWSP